MSMLLQLEFRPESEMETILGSKQLCIFLAQISSLQPQYEPILNR